MRRSTAHTVLGALDEQASRFPDDVFVITSHDEVHTFSDVRRTALAVSAGLITHGMAPGDRVAYMSTNRPELVYLTLGISYAEMVAVPINVLIKGVFLRHQLVNSAATAIAVDNVGLEALRPLLPELPDLRLIILLDPDLDEPKAIRYADLLGSGDTVQPRRPRQLDTFIILYTSGTTGPSKGCMLSQAYMIRVAHVMSRMLLLDDDDVQICVHPMFHMSGQMDLVLALITGTPIGLEQQFSASRFFDRAKELGATYWGGPGVTDMLLSQPATKDHRLRRWIGLPFSEESERILKEKFGIESICQGYAQTEVNPVAIVGLADPADRSTDGRVVDDIECQIVDDEDHQLPFGEVGEIVLRPRVPGAMFSGYWNDAERNIEAWRNLWHHTGDLGRIDAEGQIKFVDRKKDAMRRKGESISAMELEATLLGFDQIAEVATHAVRIPGRTDDDIKACIVVTPGVEFDREKFAAYVMERVPRFAMVRYYELRDALPRNPIGRVLKFELREQGVTPQTVDLFELGLTHDRRQK
jgi:crotonobetaine/carnitine-CoA ligase